MAREPTAVQIRSYQVGFGDCFLLSFIYGDSKRHHVLIDFGTTSLPGVKTRQSIHMRKVADHISSVCGKDGLTAVVATHRHADHISGFGTDAATGESGEVIRRLAPCVVLQPWTEDPDASRNARTATRDSSRSRKSFVAGLAAMHEVAAMVADAARRSQPAMSASLRRQLSFLGSDNLRNRSAVENLMKMGRRRGAVAVWAHYGSKSGLERRLPGVKVHVLGPPSLEQSEKIRTMRRRDPDQFWHLLSRAPSMHAGKAGRRGADRGGDPRMRPEARWFCDRLRKLNGEQLLEIVRTLDQQMNNTSLILLFEVFGMKLLFPGDAQIENWSYALEDAPQAQQNRELLAGVDVYKVGHHGSLNATPKLALWKNFRKRKGGKFHTLLSTLRAKHGSAASNTEVPRQGLLRALRSDSELHDTLDLKLGRNAELGHLLELSAQGLVTSQTFPA
jgi:hypothetical protein